MSRVGRMPISVPSGVTVDMKPGEVTVIGPKGQLSRQFSPDISIVLDDGILTVSRPDDSKVHRSLVGVGYRVEKSGENLIIRVGYSHPVTVSPLPGVTLETEAPNRIKVSGISKEVVGEMAAEIRRIRPPDAYKGKGIRYAGERVHLKPGKAGKVIGKK